MLWRDVVVNSQLWTGGSRGHRGHAIFANWNVSMLRPWHGWTPRVFESFFGRVEARLGPLRVRFSPLVSCTRLQGKVGEVNRRKSPNGNTHLHTITRLLITGFGILLGFVK